MIGLSTRHELRYRRRTFTRELDMGEARVFIDHGFQWDGSRNVWLTRARAMFAVGRGPVFDLKPASMFAKVRSCMARVSSGDPCFDEFFVVCTPESDATWAALSAHTRSLLASYFDDSRVVSDGTTVTFLREADCGRESDADPAAEIVGEIANYRANELTLLRHRLSAEWVPARGAWDRRCQPRLRMRTPATVDLCPTVDGEHLVMSAVTEHAGPAFSAEILADGDIHCDDGSAPPVLAPREDYARVGPARLHAGREVRVTWRRFETCPARLAAGAKLVGRIAAAATCRGVYR